MSKCERCGGDAGSTTMSIFNTEHICIECEGIEGAHPKYKRAVKIEEAEVRAKNYNYAGIGLPDDLREDAEMRKAAR